MILLTTAAVTSEKASKKAKTCLVSSKVYKLRENYSALASALILHVFSQRANSLILTSLSLLASQKHNLTEPSYLKSPSPQ
jgi:hypothetical protein